MRSFNKNECQVGCFNLANKFTDNASNAPWTGKRLGRLLNNVIKVNATIEKWRRGREEIIHVREGGMRSRTGSKGEPTSEKADIEGE
jgi:hypothetical protein